MAPVLVLFALLAAQADAPASKSQPQIEEPREEDSTLSAPVEYSFNPLKAQSECTVGNYYMKRSRFKAAADRYREATRWNPQMAEAFLKLGEAEEKNNNPKKARTAFQEFLKLDPDAKTAAEARKHLKKLPAGA